MRVYRVVSNKALIADLSGTGAYRFGGRWNSKGTYLLYTSENSSLALLETLVHFDKSLSPPVLYISEIDINDAAPIFTVPDNDYPANWLEVGLIQNQILGDRWMKESKWLAVKVRSAVNTREYNYLLNPLFPDYINLVKVVDVAELSLDSRLSQ